MSEHITRVKAQVQLDTLLRLPLFSCHRTISIKHQQESDKLGNMEGKATTIHPHPKLFVTENTKTTKTGAIQSSDEKSLHDQQNNFQVINYTTRRLLPQASSPQTYIMCTFIQVRVHCNRCESCMDIYNTDWRYCRFRGTVHCNIRARGRRRINRWCGCQRGRSRPRNYAPLNTPQAAWEVYDKCE